MRMRIYPEKEIKSSYWNWMAAAAPRGKPAHPLLV
jgi:hypothetical protein